MPSWVDEAPWSPDDLVPPDDEWAAPPPPLDAVDGGGHGGVRVASAGRIAAAPARFGTALQALHSVYGFDAFRGEQAEVIDQLAAGGDAVVLMPTGGGKSLCYQIPSLLREGTGV